MITTTTTAAATATATTLVTSTLKPITRSETNFLHEYVQYWLIRA